MYGIVLIHVTILVLFSFSVLHLVTRLRVRIKMSDNMEEVEDITESNDNESDSDDDMDDGCSKQQERIKELEVTLKENPYDYQVLRQLQICLCNNDHEHHFF